MSQQTLQEHSAHLAGLRIEAERCRQVWATVVLVAMNDAAREYKKLLGERPAAAQREIDRFTRWVRSADGREVFHLAGIEHSDRSVRLAIDAVLTGRILPQGDLFKKRAVN